MSTWLKHKSRYAIFLPMLFFFVGITAAHAATFSVVARSSSVEINQPVRIDLSLDTQGDDVNAIQGQINFPAGQFTLNNLTDGASPVSFWIQAPQQNASGVISFSGIIPGGFQGVASSVVSLWLTPVRPGVGAVSLNDLQLLKNDGSGTSISVTTVPASITVLAAAATSTPSRPVSLVTPELFTPMVSQNPNVYGGKYFLAFSTTDKGSGISGYEVAEVPAGTPTSSALSWQPAVSPYLLTDQTLSSDIYVRAIGNDGNFIVVEVPAVHNSTPLFVVAARSDIWWIIAGLALIIFFALMGYLHRQRR